MRGAILGLAVVAVAACGRTGEQGVPADTTTAVTPASPSLGAFAGRWRVVGYSEAGDSLLAYELAATADTAGWTITLPGRPAMPLRVSAVGSEVTIDAGPYESVLRPGVQVTTQGTARVEGDSLVGNTIARYTTTGPDSVLRVRTVGKRIP
ncbi:MAG: hypothetical protein ACRENB_08815 [Gemmatimonadales bacterium]